MTFAHILTVLRRRWLTIVAGVAVGAVGGLVLSMLMPAQYSATTSLVVSPIAANPFTDRQEEVNIKTEREILGSREVAERASETLGIELEPDSYLLSRVDVAAPLGSQVLQVTVQASSPTQAAESADAISTAYLEFRREGVDEISARYLEKIDAQLADLGQDGSNAALIATLQQQRLNAMLSTSEPGRIIGAATVPTHASGPGRTVLLAGGLAGGALLGLVAAIIRERADRRVRAADRLDALVAPARLVAGRPDDEEFWDTLADQVLHEIGATPLPLRILLPETGRAVSDDNEARLRDAFAIAFREGRPAPAGSTTDAAAAATDDDAVAVTRRCPRSRIVRASHGSDLAVLLVDRHDPLSDVAAAVTAMRGAELPFVVGYAGGARD